MMLSECRTRPQQSLSDVGFLLSFVVGFTFWWAPFLSLSMVCIPVCISLSVCVCTYQVWGLCGGFEETINTLNC